MSAATVHDAVLPRRRYRSRGELIGWIAAVPITVAVIWMVVTNPNFEWPVVARYFTAEAVLNGIWVTLQLTVICMLIGAVLGMVLAVMVRSRSFLLSRLAAAYIWFFRGTPLLVQLIFWFNLSALVPAIGGATINQIITPYLAAVLGLSLNEAAYMAEIARAGLISVDHGQKEAAEALGMRPRAVMWRVILPQAMRAIIPPTGNQTIGMLKNTSLVSVLGVSDLLYSTQIIYSRTFEVIPLLLVACIWYLVMTTVLSIGQFYLERYYDRGSHRRRPTVVRSSTPAITSGARA